MQYMDIKVTEVQHKYYVYILLFVVQVLFDYKYCSVFRYCC